MRYSILIVFSLLCFHLQAQNLTAIESVEYDPVNNQYLVSNETNIVAIAPDGTKSYFGNNLSAQYGMEVYNGVLYAISGNSVRGYDLNTATQVMDLFIIQSQFLNGLASDGNGNLYATDFSDRKIYKLEIASQTAVVYVNDTGSPPNGIVYDGTNNRLVFVSWGANAAIKQVDLNNGSVSTLVTTSFGNIDGIDNDGVNNFYVSSWSPNQIVKFNSDFSQMEVVSAPVLEQPADICYAKHSDTLAIPSTGDDRVYFIGFPTPVSIETVDAASIDLLLNPNPVSDQLSLSFELDKREKVDVQLIDATGKELQMIHNSSLAAGKQQLTTNLGHLPKGMYYVQIVLSDLKKITVPIIKQ